MKQNKFFLTAAFPILLVMILAAGLGGCSAAAQPDTTPGAVQGTPAPGAGGGMPGSGEIPGGGTLSQAMQLALGTLKLEGTEHAVTAEQAATLLPLWKAVRSLNTSGTAANQEVQGLFTQIEKAMTADQRAALEAMEFNPQDMAGIFQELGIEAGGGRPEVSDEMRATMQAARATAEAGGETFNPGGGPGGGFGGGPGPGGGMMPGGPGGSPVGEDSGLSAEARATAIARSGPRGAETGVSPALVEAIIRLLEAK